MSMAAWLDVEEEAEEVEEAQLDLITLVFRVRTGDQVELSTSLKTGYSQAMPWSGPFQRVSQEQPLQGHLDYVQPQHHTNALEKSVPESVSGTDAPRAPGQCSASGSH